MIADVPCAGPNMTLALTVRKFMCGAPTCPRKIVTEWLSGLVASYVRMTTRLTVLVQVIGAGAGGQLGTRLADLFGIATTPSTLLRHLMQLRTPTAPADRMLEVDDWSWKKGMRYGTIPVDLQRHKIIDLLQYCSRETFAQWLLEHPELDIISRNRGRDYTATAHSGSASVPGNRPASLVCNLADLLELLLARCRTEMIRRWS